MSDREIYIDTHKIEPLEVEIEWKPVFNEEDIALVKRVQERVMGMLEQGRVDELTRLSTLARQLATYQHQGPLQVYPGHPHPFPYDAVDPSYDTRPLEPPAEQKTAYAWLVDPSVKVITDGTYRIYVTDLQTLDIVDSSSLMRVYLASDIEDLRRYVDELDNEAFVGGFERLFMPDRSVWQQGETYR